MLTDFNHLPPESRLWIFAAERQLTPAEEGRLLHAVDTFLSDWKAHGQPLAAARELRYGQFLLIAVDESTAGASGCSIDAMVRVLARLEQELRLELLDHGPVYYWTDKGIQRVDRGVFADLARSRAVSPDTIVFNNTLTHLLDVRAGRWEVRARDSWHAGAFFQSELMH